MKKKALGSCSHNPNTGSTIQDSTPVKIRSDPTVSSDHLIDEQTIMGRWINFFAGIALPIGCMGLYGN